MTNIFTAKTKKATSDIAKKVRKTAKEEIFEFKKSVASQITGTNEQGNAQQQNQVSPVVEAMQQGVVPVTDSQHENIHNEEKRKLDYLQKELEDLRRKRIWEAEQKQMAALQQQQQQNENKLLKPLDIPTSRPKRGLFSSKKKQGTKEMGKQISG
jgi:hypothetical protein